MLKFRELTDCAELFELMQHPDVFPYVRQKTVHFDEFLFSTKQIIELEEQGNIISRTITNEYGTPIGTISLFDVESGYGFLGTWLGKPYHGKGYNQVAKEVFFSELFFELDIESVFLKIRKSNERSIAAAEKLPYAFCANEIRSELLAEINQGDVEYVLYEVSKSSFQLYLHALHVPEYEVPYEAQLEA
ncbi:GNAT family N-acetyltransferase [Exiguobacterium sp. TRN 1102]|uniref:GNAT family N-acetyltransferase n=1 Tax=Exiguobacterium sp. TRN 1102 TaxID=3420732 RepID=UPI003D76A55F